MMERKNSVRIQPQQVGQQLLDFISQRFTYRSREEWQAELTAHRFLLNDTEARGDAVLAAGDRLVYLMDALIEPPVATDYTILHEDDDLLVIDKPAPLPCHPGGRFFAHTLWALLKENHGFDNPRLINRLDRETSGLVLVAKNKAAARLCQAQFIQHTVEKVYLVVVEGDFPDTPIGVEAIGWLGVDPESAIRKKMRFYPTQNDAPPGAAESSTEFHRISTASNGSLSLVAAKPHTGRCHQIRATLLHLGFPVVGDKLYGLDEQLFLRFKEGHLSATDHTLLRIPRQALHAASLRLNHPTTGKELEFSAPLPSALQGLLAGR
ncbi:RluA family pseudouridine synthase [Thiovibrio frasassiensis]|uniref:Pseudouridine synthase n=1 Tax=Thiovibrio frasassiensis TaxID=2984131 RepID=A0A9X4MEI0_9BACT|nr:RluA family pseudouridine synthase [Thiovibrio frasassiensis]MDG4475167.1 RluA family pseudouridine synthase [Thiovibrio frasassiensis]